VRRAIITVICLSLAYGAFSLLVWGTDFGHFDSAIADVLVVTRAQVYYAELNGGFHESDLSCLHRPGTCIPSQKSSWSGRSIVEAGPHTASLSAGWMRDGRDFTAGPAPDTREIEERGLSPTSVRGFRYVADASSKRPWWARLSFTSEPPVGFCGDATGKVCELAALPTLKEVQCPANCVPTR
jgi:hypothetical protein